MELNHLPKVPDTFALPNELIFFVLLYYKCVIFLFLNYTFCFYYVAKICTLFHINKFYLKKNRKKIKKN